AHLPDDDRKPLEVQAGVVERAAVRIDGDERDPRFLRVAAVPSADERLEPLRHVDANPPWAVVVLLAQVVDVARYRIAVTFGAAADAVTEEIARAEIMRVVDRGRGRVGVVLIGED